MPDAPRLRRQPVHTVYGGAHLFKPDTTARLGTLALRTLREYAPDAPALARALGLDLDLAARIYPRILDKLAREPVEDYRLDFEDGFGNRPDEEEDAVARQAAANVATGLAEGTLPSGIGIRIKTLSEETLGRRSLRTFDIFLTALVSATGGALPDGFVVTLPKITAPDQVARLAAACATFERAHNLQAQALRFEIMVETPRSILLPDGRAALPSLIAQGAGRIVAAHFGAYDYTGALGITAAHQHMSHPACDFARHMMQVCLADTDIWLSDGATNLMPIPPHKTPPGGALSDAEQAANAEVVRHAWRSHANQVRHSLVSGFYQGWDLHPAQLPARFAAVYAFFLEGLAPASARLKNFVEKSAQATLVGEVFDDAATGQGLLNYFLRAMNCGAVSEAEAVEMSGLTVSEIRSRSFAAIVRGRRG
jgi:citrate lyase beta subunit